MAPRGHLGELEELVLLAVLRLGGHAYGASLLRELRARTGRAPSVSTIYVTLMRLESKGLVTSRVGDSSTAKGGRPRRLFSTTADGVAELRASKRARTRLWEGLDGELGPSGARGE